MGDEQISLLAFVLKLDLHTIFVKPEVFGLIKVDTVLIFVRVAFISIEFKRHG
jgi:hypothetical protein